VPAAPAAAAAASPNKAPSLARSAGASAAPRASAAAAAGPAAAASTADNDSALDLHQDASVEGHRCSGGELEEDALFAAAEEQNECSADGRGAGGEDADSDRAALSFSTQSAVQART